MADLETMIVALVRRMVERGVLDLDDINAIADELAGKDAEGAHLLRFSGLEAAIGPVPGEAEHQATIRRRSMRLIEPDGGKLES